MILAHFVALLASAGRLQQRAVIVGGGAIGGDLLRELGKNDKPKCRLLGVFDDRTDERSPDTVAGYPKLGNVDDLVDFARPTRIDLVIFALPITAEQRILQMLRKLWVLPIDIRLAAHANRLRFRPRSYSYVGKVPVLDLFDKPIADWDIVIKQAFDRIVGALALVLLSPILSATALAMKLEFQRAGVLQAEALGFNNELIEVFKFRSMYVDQLDPTAAKLVTRDDPRVTRVGRFIRKTSIDELPQLFNVVFKGNLSLVGPRPHAVHAKAADRQYDEVVDGYFARHRVKPGITGWAQVNGWRGETDTQEKIQRRVEHDLYYIENWSILLDLYILAITPIALVRTRTPIEGGRSSVSRGREPEAHSAASANPDLYAARARRASAGHCAKARRRSPATSKTSTSRHRRLRRPSAPPPPPRRARKARSAASPRRPSPPPRRRSRRGPSSPAARCGFAWQGLPRPPIPRRG